MKTANAKKAVNIRKATQEDFTIVSSPILEALGAVESSVTEDALALERITRDIKAVQLNLRKLRFSGLLKESLLEISSDEFLSYNFETGAISHVTTEGAKRLLEASPQVRKMVHANYLVDLLNQINDDYKMSREKTD